MTDKRQATLGHQYPCFAGDGEAARMMRATDWAATPLGPVEGCPPGLGSIVATLLGSRQPMFLWWGPELVQFYNDAYIPSFGQGKHPAAMGQRGRDCRPELWPIIGPQGYIEMFHAVARAAQSACKDGRPGFWRRR